MLFLPFWVHVVSYVHLSLYSCLFLCVCHVYISTIRQSSIETVPTSRIYLIYMSLCFVFAWCLYLTCQTHRLFFLLLTGILHPNNRLLFLVCTLLFMYLFISFSCFKFLLFSSFLYSFLILTRWCTVNALLCSWLLHFSGTAVCYIYSTGLNEMTGQITQRAALNCSCPIAPDGTPRKSQLPSGGFVFLAWSTWSSAVCGLVGSLILSCSILCVYARVCACVRVL